MDDDARCGLSDPVDIMDYAMLKQSNYHSGVCSLFAPNNVPVNVQLVISVVVAILDLCHPQLVKKVFGKRTCSYALTCAS